MCIGVSEDGSYYLAFPFFLQILKGVTYQLLIVEAPQERYIGNTLGSPGDLKG